MTLHRLIEEQFREWGVRSWPDFSRWLNIEKFSEVTGIKPEQVLGYVIKSKTFHGLIYGNSRLMIHPDAVFRQVARKSMQKIDLLTLETNSAEVGDGAGKPAA